MPAAGPSQPNSTVPGGGFGRSVALGATAPLIAQERGPVCAEPRSAREQSNEGDSDDIHRRRRPGLIRTSRHRGQSRRHLSGVVRLLHLRHGRRAGVRRDLLPQLRPAGRHPARVHDVRGGFRGPAAGRRRLRPLRRQARPQERARGDAADHGHRHLPDRPAAHVCVDRRVGADPARDAALPAGPGARRGVGRRGADDARVRLRAPARAERQLAAGRGADRAAAGQRGAVTDGGGHLGGGLRRLGVAGSVPAQRRAGASWGCGSG